MLIYLNIITFSFNVNKFVKNSILFDMNKNLAILQNLIKFCKYLNIITFFYSMFVNFYLSSIICIPSIKIPFYSIWSPFFVAKNFCNNYKI